MTGEVVDHHRDDLVDRLGARALLDALPRALIVVDSDGRIRLWNRAAQDLYGWSADEVVGRPYFEVLAPPGDRDEHVARLARLVSGAASAGDRSVLRSDGTALLVHSTATPVLGADGAVAAVISLSDDVTDERSTSRRMHDLNEHLQLALDAGNLGTWRWNLRTGVTEWDATLEAIYGLEPGGFDGSFEAYASSLHADDRERVLGVVQDAVDRRSSYRIEHRIVRPDGVVRWVACAGEVTVADDGTPTGTLGCVSDVSERVERSLELERVLQEREASLARERLQRERFEFLSTLNEVLNEAETVAEIMADVSATIVPRLGDWCAIHVLPSGGGVPEVVFAQAEGVDAGPGARLLERFPYDPSALAGVAEVIRTGRTEFHPEVTPEALAALDLDADSMELVRQLGLGSAISVPIVKRGRVLGAMQFVRSVTSRPYTADDVALAELVAVRVAASVENRRLVESHRQTAMALQEGLLPGDLPEIDGVDLAVGYWPAGEGAQVGGDFYDVFEADEERWALVVGDVCGRGPFAAAVTGLARHSLRDAVWHGDEPDDVLRSLNRALLRSGFKTFCTAVYGTLRPVGGGVDLTVSVGGHPLPIVLRAGSAPAFLGRPGTLLGALPETQSTTTTVSLRPGDQVVFYTDGATDLAPPNDLTPAQFADLVAEAAGVANTAKDLADQIQARLHGILPFRQRNDDLALLVLRVCD